MVCRRHICRSTKEELGIIANIREELIDLLENAKPVKDFFTNPDLPALIMREDDVKGLDRLRIVFTYLDRATCWHAKLGEKAGAMGS